MKHAIVVGAGYAGAVCARMLADTNEYHVTVIDRRGHIAGNMYDGYNEDGILVHWYGPHISVMNEKRVFDFLSRFTSWVPYHHRVNAEIDGKEVPLPINFTSIDLLFSVEKAMALKSALCREYGEGGNVPILEMRKCQNGLIQEFAGFVFEKVFFHYTTKMWGLTPDEIDPSVTGRIPVRLSYDNRHFLHTYQVMPEEGFTRLFERMLDHPNIEVKLELPSSDVLELDGAAREVLAWGEPFKGTVFYTGALDELFQFSEGPLPYRSLEFTFESWKCDYIQDSTVLNWPDERPETRRTEMKRLTGQKKAGVTTTIVERPGAYERGAARFGEPLYPIDTQENRALYQRYQDKAAQYPQIVPVGRLADYKYYNMEAAILRAMSIMDQFLRKSE